MDSSSWIKATYQIKTDDKPAAAIAMARGQSIGNPTMRTKYDAKLKRFEAIASWIESDLLMVKYPLANFDPEPNISHIMSVLMGGQMDIDLFKSCRLINVTFGELEKKFPRPKFGIEGIRNWLQLEDRPIIGSVIKPKVGLTPSQLADLVWELCQGGVDFIKEDEILSPASSRCELLDRINKVGPVLKRYRRESGNKVLYAPCITSDGDDIALLAWDCAEAGMTAIHFNWWCGFGAYLYMRQVHRGLNLPMFYQRSGYQVMTTGPFSISDNVVYKIINLIGCDFAHIGMYGGYSGESETQIKERLAVMGDTIPSFSCGMEPSKIQPIVDKFGPDVMCLSGGWVHSYPKGPKKAIKELVEAANATIKH